jgi:hypothetical protein
LSTKSRIQRKKGVIEFERESSALVRVLAPAPRRPVTPLQRVLPGR